MCNSNINTYNGYINTHKITIARPARVCTRNNEVTPTHHRAQGSAATTIGGNRVRANTHIRESIRMSISNGISK